MIQFSKRLEQWYLTAIPTLVTIGLAVVTMASKHISGLNQFMPLLPVCAIFYWTIVQARSLSYIFIFLLGLVMDSVAGLPLGLTSLTYLVFVILILTQRKYIHKEGFMIKLIFFAGLLAVDNIFCWLALSFFYSSAQPVGAATLQWLLTSCCYPLVHKACDSAYDYIQSRRWQITHGS